MIIEPRIYHAAQREVQRLKKKMDAKQATTEDRSRYQAGIEEIICYELCEDGARQREQWQREREAAPPRSQPRRTPVVAAPPRSAPTPKKKRPAAPAPKAKAGKTRNLSALRRMVGGTNPQQERA